MRERRVPVERERLRYSPAVRGSLFLFVLMLATTVSPVFAQAPAEAPREQDADARDLFDRANEAYRDARYEQALEYFEAAYALSERAELQYNIGLCHERLDQDAEAIAAFESYLRDRPDAANADNVRARIRRAREQLGQPGETDESSGGADLTVPIALAIAGGVVAAGGGAMLGVGLAQVGDVESTPDGTRAWRDVQGDADLGVTLQTAGWVALGVGITAALIGLVMLAVGGS